jgi:hypothetical protein
MVEWPGSIQLILPDGGPGIGARHVVEVLARARARVLAVGWDVTWPSLWGNGWWSRRDPESDTSMTIHQAIHWAITGEDRHVFPPTGGWVPAMLSHHANRALLGSWDDDLGRTFDGPRRDIDREVSLAIEWIAARPFERPFARKAVS